MLKAPFNEDGRILLDEAMAGFLKTRRNRLVLGERFIERPAAAQ